MTDDFKTVTPTDDGLGHSDRELKRLEQLELLIGPFTRRSFHEAGIGTDCACSRSAAEPATPVATGIRAATDGPAQRWPRRTPATVGSSGDPLEANRASERIPAVLYLQKC